MSGWWKWNEHQKVDHENIVDIFIENIIMIVIDFRKQKNCIGILKELFAGFYSFRC